MRWRWQGELWTDDWEREFCRRRDLLPSRNAGTVAAAKRNFLRNRERLEPKNDFLNGHYFSGRIETACRRMDPAKLEAYCKRFQEYLKKQHFGKTK